MKHGSDPLHKEAVIAISVPGKTTERAFQCVALTHPHCLYRQKAIEANLISEYNTSNARR